MLHVLGIDIGSVALSIVLVDENCSVVHSSYQFHNGAISEKLRSMLDEIDIGRVGGIAMTLSGPEILTDVSRYDTQIAMIAAVKSKSFTWEETERRIKSKLFTNYPVAK